MSPACDYILKFTIMQLSRITDPASETFRRLMDLYELSFPPAERRDRQSLARLLGNEGRMHFCAIIDDDGAMAGLLVYWDLHTFIYMEHLAVFPDMRNRGIGRRLLQHLPTLYSKPLVLEAEPADDGMAGRRIDFYRRNGFDVVETDYIQPAYKAGGDQLPLWIMAHGKMDSHQVQEAISTIKTEIYHNNR